MLEWLERSRDKPTWEEIAPHSDNTKVYCAQWQSLQLLNGVLYRLWETPSGDSVVKQLILPESLRTEVLQELHNTRTAGHLGVAKTRSRVQGSSIGSSVDAMSKNGAATVIFALRRGAHRERLKHQWQSTMLALQWSALQLMCWGHYPSPKQGTSTF